MRLTSPCLRVAFYGIRHVTESAETPEIRTQLPLFIANKLHYEITIGRIITALETFY